jgi:hypothetical protein
MGTLTWDEALGLDAAAVDGLVELYEGCGPVRSEGVRVCERLNLPAVAAPIAAW